MSWLPALGFAACAVVARAPAARGGRRRSPAPGASTSPSSPPPRRSAPAPTTPSPPRPPTRPTTRAPLVLLLALLHDRARQAAGPQARTASYAALAAVAVGLAAYAQVGLYRDNGAAVHTAARQLRHHRRPRRRPCRGRSTTSTSTPRPANRSSPCPPTPASTS